MSEIFEIDIVRAQQAILAMDVMKRQLQTDIFSIDSIKSGMATHSSMYEIAGFLEDVKEAISSDISSMAVFRNVLEEVIYTYSKCENTLTKIGTSHRTRYSSDSDTLTYNRNTNLLTQWMAFLGLGDSFTENEIDSVVYDDQGSYGGDQSGPKSQWGPTSQKQELYDLVREYYPNMTDKSIQQYLKKLSSEGCGYVALVNTLFTVYEGKEELFEQEFGFPMYQGNDLNYNHLLVDLYCDTDNHNLVNGVDVLNQSEDPSNVSGKGTTVEDRGYRLQKYLDDKNASVSFSQTKYSSSDITVENYADFARDSSIIISYRNGYLLNEAGDKIQPINGGHAMTVTGTTSDGRLIVSSWGEKYYIDPSDQTSCNGSNVKIKYQAITYQENGK